MAELETATHVSFPVYFLQQGASVILPVNFLFLLFLESGNNHLLRFSCLFLQTFFFLVDYQTILQESQTITATCLHMKNLFPLNLFQVRLGVVHVVEIF